MSRHVHLVGSVPAASAADVFEMVSAALGPRLLRIPDGETGERNRAAQSARTERMSGHEVHE